MTILHIWLLSVSGGSALLLDLSKKKISLNWIHGWFELWVLFIPVFDVHLVPADVRAVGVEALCRCLSECQFGQITAGSHYTHLSAC